MPSRPAETDSRATPSPAGPLRWLLAAATAISFLLVLQNYGLDLFPHRRIHLSPERIRPYSDAKTFAYVYDFNGSEPDIWPSERSRLGFSENGQAYRLKMRQPDEVILVGGDRFTHEPGRIVFSTIENNDPRTNGRDYEISAPVLYRPAVGYAAALTFLGCVGAWCLVCRRAPREDWPRRPVQALWPWHLAGAAALFLLGLYCNTGTLAPYANTNFPLVVPSNGYAYNQDHIHFRVLFDFVDGRDRSVWDHAILLRRILFPVLAWPLMKVLGFELGGTLTSLVINTAAFVAALVVLRRWIGERGAIMAGWLLALYPGAAYWAGLPYTYAVIFPASLLLMLGLMRLAGAPGWRALSLVSFAMGVLYLGYDFAALFVPASLLVLLWRRRPVAAALSALIQVAPLAAWMYALGHVFHQQFQNGNSGIYIAVLTSFFHGAGSAWWWQQLARAPGSGFDIFFASNFIFLPALFLSVLVLNPLTSRIRFRVAEVALLACGLALFLALNLAPSDSGGWEMRGTWISRIYQPVFPALVVYVARWWHELPPLTQRWRALLLLIVAAATVGDALIVFGPILGDPWRVSEYAFYRFYDHTDAHFVYEQNLRDLGRRPLGFPRVIKAPTLEEVEAQRRGQLAAARRALDDIRKAIGANRSALMQVQRAYRDVGRGVAEARSALYAKRLEGRAAKGEMTQEEARKEAKGFDDFVWPALKAVLDDRELDSKEPLPAPEPAPLVISEVQVAIVADSAKLTALEQAISQTQSDLKTALSDLARAQDELDRANRGDLPAAPR